MPSLIRPTAAVTLVLLFTLSARAQVTPDRTYYGRHRPVPMTVRIPPELKGEAQVGAAALHRSTCAGCQLA